MASEQPPFDRQWARSAPVHELSAHGRAVARRLADPPPRASSGRARPSVWKRLRFHAYRLLRR